MNSSARWLPCIKRSVGFAYASPILLLYIANLSGDVKREEANKLTVQKQLDTLRLELKSHINELDVKEQELGTERKARLLAEQQRDTVDSALKDINRELVLVALFSDHLRLLYRRHSSANAKRAMTTMKKTTSPWPP
jgi:hypothetical protein